MQRGVPIEQRLAGRSYGFLHRLACRIDRWAQQSLQFTRQQRDDIRLQFLHVVDAQLFVAGLCVLEDFLDA